MMETERSPLRSSSSPIPRYTFLGGENSRKRFPRWSRCCFCIVLMALLAITLAIVLSYQLISGRADGTSQEKGLNELYNMQWPLREEFYTEIPGNLNDGLRAFEFGSEGLREKDILEEVIPPVASDSPSFRLQMATHTTKQAQEMSRLGFVLNLAAKAMDERSTHWKNIKPKKWVFKEPQKWNVGEGYLNDTITYVMSPYRTASGVCNNLGHPTWGAALRPFRRILLPKYDDRISEPRNAWDGRALPSARAVSLAIHRPVYRNDVNFTLMLAVWGQFIDHDITATAISREQLNEIRKATLAKVICETSGVTRSQPHVMRRIGIRNELTPCDEFSFPDLTAWKEA